MDGDSEMEKPILHPSPRRPQDATAQLPLPGLDPDRKSRPRRLSRVARASGYRTARARISAQAARLIVYLQAHGPATDHACSLGLGLPLASINSIRNGLVQRGLVVAVDTVPGPCGASRTRWRVR